MTDLLDGPADPPAHGATDANGELAKAEYVARLQAWQAAWQAKVAARTAAKAVEVADQTAKLAAEAALLKDVHDAYIEVSKSSLDRAMTRANVVITSTGAITTIYTTLLALKFYLPSKDLPGEPLTGVALIPALFLGLALLLVTIYAAMFKRHRKSLVLLPTGIGGTIAESRLKTFMDWCNAGVYARAWALHAGIVSLGFGIVSLPVPFVNLRGYEQLLILIGGVTAIGLTAIMSLLNAGNDEEDPPNQVVEPTLVTTPEPSAEAGE